MKPLFVLAAFFLLCLAFSEVGWADDGDDAACPEDGVGPSAEASQVLAVDDHGRGHIVQKASLNRPLGEPQREPLPDVPAPAALRLEGVISSAGKAFAIIDGGFYREGDCVGGFLVTSIQRDRVVLEKGDRKASLVIR